MTNARRPNNFSFCLMVANSDAPFCADGRRILSSTNTQFSNPLANSKQPSP